MTSKFTAAPPVKRWARHSTMNVRVGALPETAVKMPSPAWLVTRSSKYGKTDGPKVLVGRQTLLKSVRLLVNWTLPLELTLALVYGVPYKEIGKGSESVV